MSKKISGSKRISIDFDRVIHQYTKGWYDGTIYDTPVPGAIEAIKRLISQGYIIYILTARSSDKETRNVAIAHWLYDQGFEVDYINCPDDTPNTMFSLKDHPKVTLTNTKYPSRFYIDDRALRFTNWRDIISYLL